MKTFQVNIQWRTKRGGVSLHLTAAAETRGEAIETALCKHIDKHPARVLVAIMITEIEEERRS